MTTLTWIGGGNNNANNPKDWSPRGVPQTGDTLVIPGNATMNITGSGLATADYLAIGNDASGESGPGVPITNTITLNATNAILPSINEVTLNDKLTINLHGVNYMNLTSGEYTDDTTTINIDGTWVGTFGWGSQNLTIKGGNFINDGGSAAGFDGSIATINANVLGNGSFGLSNYHGGLGTLKFMKSVGSGQTVDIGGGFTGGQLLIIDHPTEFAAQVDLNSSQAVIDLNNLANAHSYSYKADMLTIYGTNGKALDSLRLNNSSDGATTAFSVEKTASGVAILGSAAFEPPHGTLLPLHT